MRSTFDRQILGDCPAYRLATTNQRSQRHPRFEYSCYFAGFLYRVTQFGGKVKVSRREALEDARSTLTMAVRRFPSLFLFLSHIRAFRVYAWTTATLDVMFGRVGKVSTRRCCFVEMIRGDSLRTKCLQVLFFKGRLVTLVSERPSFPSNVAPKTSSVSSPIVFNKDNRR